MKKAAVFSHSGLGDVIISLVVSNNLHQNGWQVDTFHNGFQAMQSWFPHLPILMLPKKEETFRILEKYDLLIVFQDDTNEFILQLIEEGKRKDALSMKVIYPIPSKGVRLKPYYQDSLFDPTISIVENLRLFCSEILNLPKTTKFNGVIVPLHLKFRKNPKRICFHVSSTRPGKNWPIDKFVKLALHLTEEGFQPAMIAGGPKDRKDYEWLEKEGLFLPSFPNLEDLASFIYESGYLIGNDSGLGHLASCMGIPTVTISRRRTSSRFWRPGWALGKIVNPHFLIPNISGFRLRDRKWKTFISVNKVKKAFYELIKEENK